MEREYNKQARFLKRPVYTLHFITLLKSVTMSWKEGHISGGATFTIGALPNFCVFLLAYLFFPFFSLTGRRERI